MSINYITEPNKAKNNGGQILANGTTISQNFETTPVKSYQTTSFASTVTNSNDVSRAVNTASLPYNNNSPIAKKLTSKITGRDNTVLMAGALRPELLDSINDISSIRTVRTTAAIRAGNFNLYTGKFSVAPTVSLDDFGTDFAATVYRLYTGSLRYKIGSSTTQTNYSKKTT